MTSRTRNIQPQKKNYDGIFVSNLEEDLDTDIFALHDSQTDTKTTSRSTSNKLVSYGGIGNSAKPKTDSVKTSGAPRTPISNPTSNTGLTSNKDASTPTSQNDDSTQNNATTRFSPQRSSVQNSDMIKRQTECQKNDTVRENNVGYTSVNQRRHAPNVQIAQRSHVARQRKMDVKGFGHETEDLEVQNLDDDF